jgi:signal transduction histidine kinase
VIGAVPAVARRAPDGVTSAVRGAVAATGLGLALVSAAWIVPATWPTYAVFFGLAFAYSFVWLDSDAPTSVPHMATATAFVYIAGAPVLFVELVARLLAYPVLYLAARERVIGVPRALRPLVQPDATRAREARLDFAAMLGLATIGLAVRVGVVQGARAAGIESRIVMMAFGEPVAYAVMGVLSGWLPLPTRDYVVAAPERLPPEDERVDVIFGAVLIVPFFVGLMLYGYRWAGLAGAAGWSLASFAPHALLQLLVRRRHLLDERHLALARKQEELEQLTFAVTHDLKPVVAGATLVADRLIGAPGHDPAEVRADAKDLLRLLKKTHQMVADLLLMVALVARPEPVGTVDLGAIIAEAVELRSPQIASRRIRVTVAVPMPAVPGQATKLGHVFANLIDNAVRFVPAGTGAIEISATRKAGAVVVSVRDNGVGIPDDYHEEIFRIFRRAPNGDGDSAGTGIGLALVKRIVGAHGGRVSVESSVGAGTVFRVWLPDGVAG